MIKDNQRRLNRVHVLLDALITILAYALAWFVVISGNVMDTPGGTLPPRIYFAALIFVVPAYLILYASFHLYTPKRIQGRRSEFANICKANIIGLMLFTFVLFGARSFMAHNEYFSPECCWHFPERIRFFWRRSGWPSGCFSTPCGPMATIRSIFF